MHRQHTSSLSQYNPLHAGWTRKHKPTSQLSSVISKICPGQGVHTKNNIRHQNNNTHHQQQQQQQTKEAWFQERFEALWKSKWLLSPSFFNNLIIWS